MTRFDNVLDDDDVYVSGLIGLAAKGKAWQVCLYTRSFL